MPSVLLPVPLYSQSRPGTCLPACARMVLAYFDHTISEESIGRVLGTRHAGTPVPNITRLSSLGFSVRYAALTESDVQLQLQAEQPLICRLWTVMLDYWPTDTPHVAVVVGYDDRYVYLNDPAFPDAPQRVLWDGFLAAWEEYDCMAAIIQPSAR
ncbi:MAG: C39 family peptidase [Chloroflexi bacterium]|nr:C39 family peptidase [Chloroflexota bacterium]